MLYTYTLGSSKITIDADSEAKAARSFKEATKSFFPDKAKEQWNRETQEFYARPDIVRKLFKASRKKTATMKTRAKIHKPLLRIKPFHFD